MALRGFGGYHGLGRSASECVERQSSQPGEDRGGEVPYVAKSPGGPLDGQCERVGSLEVGRRHSRRIPSRLCSPVSVDSDRC